MSYSQLACLMEWLLLRDQPRPPSLGVPPTFYLNTLALYLRRKEALYGNDALCEVLSWGDPRDQTCGTVSSGVWPL